MEGGDIPKNRVDLSFWHGTDSMKGKREEMEEEEEKGNSGIMKLPIIEEKEMMDIIKKMKNGKAAGVDGIRAELMKHITRNDSIRKHMVKCCNNVLNEKVQEDWLQSKTTMIPKTKKPKILEHRPIAVTVISSKIMCSLFREKIEEHLNNCNIRYENQYGFTKGGRIEHCLFTLDYIANMTYESNNKKHKALYFTFIDFKKAYDSIHRGKLIEVLIKYKVNPKVIDIIVQMYERDRTTIQLGKMKETIEVTCGIRQGCSISTLLFKMVTFTIIQELQEKAEIYKIRKYSRNSLWLADDATIIATDEKSVATAIQTLETAGGKCGLELSIEKTKILRIRGPKIGDKIEKHKIEEEAKYQGLQYQAE